MDQPVELIPLVCLQCATPLPAEPDEVAWVCAQCGTGQMLDEEKGLVPLEVQYASGVPVNQKGKPYWVADGQVTLQRSTYGSSHQEDEQARQFWSSPRRFFVPAYQRSLEELLKAGIDLLFHPPDLKSGAATAFEPITLHLEDVTSAAEFIVAAVEAGRKDKVKALNFSLKLGEPFLWVLP